MIRVVDYIVSNEISFIIMSHLQLQFHQTYSQICLMIETNKNITKSLSNNIHLQTTEAQNTLLFSYQHYPFPNHNTNLTLFKTVIHMDFTHQKLEKIISINHANLLAVRKISKISCKGKGPKQGNNKFYSFFYEVAEYGLKHIVQHPQEQSKLLNEVVKLDLKNIIASIISFLAELAIYYTIKIDDIGVDSSGNVKVYIPSTAVLFNYKDSKYNRNANQINSWWQSVITPILNFKKFKNFSQLMPPKLPMAELDNFSLNSSTVEQQFDEVFNDCGYLAKSYNLKESMTSESSAITKIGAYKLQRLKLIDKEVMIIKQKLNEKTKRKGIQQKPIQLKKSASNNKISSNIIHIQHQHNYNHEPERQQPQQQPPLPPKQQTFHYSKVTQERANDYQNAPIGQDIYQMYNEQMSQDTYQLEFQNQHQPPLENNRQNIILPVERQQSQYSHQQNTKMSRVKQPPKKHKKSINQVQIGNSNITTSAGPLHFQKIMKKLRSQQNLCQSINNDKMLQRLGSDKRGQKGKMMQNEQDAEIVAPKSTLLSESIGVSENYSWNVLSVHAKKVSDFKKLPTNITYQSCALQLNTTSNLKRSRSYNQILVSKQPAQQGGPIEQKIKRALQKTKNAIEFLKRVKSCKNTLMQVKSK